MYLAYTSVILGNSKLFKDKDAEPASSSQEINSIKISIQFCFMILLHVIVLNEILQVKTCLPSAWFGTILHQQAQVHQNEHRQEQNMHNVTQTVYWKTACFLCSCPAWQLNCFALELSHCLINAIRQACYKVKHQGISFEYHLNSNDL